MKVYDTPLQWNVFIEDFNAKEIKIANIFDLSIRFKESFIKDYKKFKTLSEEFFTEVRKDLQWAYWSKCEYEIMLTPQIRSKQDTELKIDIFRQVMLNWDAFKTYLLANEPLIKKYVRSK